MKFCAKCGNANTDEAVFCGSCGTPMEQAPAAPPTAEAAVPQPAAPAPPAYEAPAYSGAAYAAPAAPAPAEVKNTATLWLILNIVATVLCCPSALFSIIGLILAAMGMSSFKKGDYEDMRKKAKFAMILFIVTLVLGIIGWIITMIGAPVLIAWLNDL
jgi:uncharacterized membrane protein